MSLAFDFDGARGFARSPSATPIGYSVQIRWRHAEPTPSFFDLARRQAWTRFENELKEMAGEAGCDGWDGEGSRAVVAQAVERTRQLVHALSDALPMPESSISHQGQVIVEWNRGPRLSLAVSIPGRGQISYSLYNRGSKTHGSLDFIDGEVAPELDQAATNWLRAAGN